MTPSLSIVIPAYNAAAYLAESVGSALAQSLPDIEVIVVDDGSTDETWDVILACAADPRLVPLRQRHAGVAVARNTALALVRAPFVGFLDADDRWLPDKGRRHVEALAADPGLDVSFSWWRVIDEYGRDTGRRARPRPGPISAEELLLENVIGTPVVRTEVLRAVGGFHATLRTSCEYDCWLRIAERREGNVACLPEVLMEYRRRGGQTTSDWRSMMAGWERVMTRARTRRGIAPHIEAKARARYLRYAAFIAYEAGEYGDARQLVRRAWSLRPRALLTDRRAWLTTAAAAATLLPARWHQRLQAAAVRLRADLAAGTRTQMGADAENRAGLAMGTMP